MNLESSPNSIKLMLMNSPKNRILQVIITWQKLRLIMQLQLTYVFSYKITRQVNLVFDQPHNLWKYNPIGMNYLQQDTIRTFQQE
jgi:hypothetical protein